MKKAKKFSWDKTYKEAFLAVKQTLSQLPVLRKPIKGLSLLVYQATLLKAVSVAVVQGSTKQKPSTPGFRDQVPDDQEGSIGSRSRLLEASTLLPKP